jgi:hypothetical protein
VGFRSDCMLDGSFSDVVVVVKGWVELLLVSGRLVAGEREDSELEPGRHAAGTGRGTTGWPPLDVATDELDATALETNPEVDLTSLLMAAGGRDGEVDGVGRVSRRDADEGVSTRERSINGDPRVALG